MDCRCVEQKQWRTQIEIGPDEIADALAMTYRAGRWSEQSRIASIDATKVTLSADLLQFREDRRSAHQALRSAFDRNYMMGVIPLITFFALL